jgi:alkylation response protein AidB-like acyl-CoA dehydrogenase
MINFELDDEQKLIRETVIAFARVEIRPHAREADEKGSVPAALLQRGWDLGLVQSMIPEEYGGFGTEHSALTGAVIAEELAYGDLAIATHLLAPRLLTVPLLEFGSTELKSRLLPAFCGESFEPGSAAVVEPRFDFDPTAPATTLRREGDDYVVSGAKCYVPLGAQAKHLLVLAGLTNGDGAVHPQAIVVARDTPGLRIGEREKNMGLKALETTTLDLDACRVPRDQVLAVGDQAAMRRLANLWRVGVSAMAVGVARAAYDYAREYAKERRAFGQAIGQKQAIAFMLAEMAMEVDAMRLLVWEAAWKLDRHEDATREAYLARRYTSDVTLRIADNALQVLGGHGYIRDHMVELFLRNARGFATLEGLAIA